MSKRRLILGTAVFVLFSCLLVYVSIDFQNYTSAHSMVEKADDIAMNLVFGILALASVGSAITAIGISLGMGNSSLKVLRESLIVTTVPLYFIFGFAPVVIGAALIVILGNISIGIWLVGIGILTMLILLGLALRKG